MGKSIVHNSGSSSLPMEEIHLQFGMFFDGTSNNRRNTEIRKKVQGVDEYKGAVPTPDELKIYNKEGKGRSWTNAWWNVKEKDNSFANDFTNVARLYFCTERIKYAVYVEGIGTSEEKDDTNEGLALGSGKTGIRGKVRLGCESLAKRIGKLKRKNDSSDKKITEITLDVFGFSRGAAAARNFVYEVNSQKKRPQDVAISETTKVIGYEVVSYGTGAERAVTEPMWIDRDKKEVDLKYVDDGGMPTFGYLGYCLLKEGVFTAEELMEISIVIRFIGVYDTVASYNEVNDSLIPMVGELLLNFIKNKLNIGFDGAIESLQLNNLGSYTKAVHLTAMDEHRLNFALTKFPGATEKSLPGVHSDIGGSYNNMFGEKDHEKVVLGMNLRLPEFIVLKRKLVSEYWYTEEQLSNFIDLPQKQGILEHAVDRILRTAAHGIKKSIALSNLIGKRELSKTYSYIPLQFMEKFFTDTLCIDKEWIMTKETKDGYDFSNDEVLNSAEARLWNYVFEGGKKWEFISDKVIKEKLAPKNTNKTEEQEEIFLTPIAESDTDGSIVLGEVIIKMYQDQEYLRELRSGYLHRSANFKALGMQPTANWESANCKRKEY